MRYYICLKQYSKACLVEDRNQWEVVRVLWKGVVYNNQFLENHPFLEMKIEKLVEGGFLIICES